MVAIEYIPSGVDRCWDAFDQTLLGFAPQMVWSTQTRSDAIRGGLGRAIRAATLASIAWLPLAGQDPQRLATLRLQPVVLGQGGRHVCANNPPGDAARLPTISRRRSTMAADVHCLSSPMLTSIDDTGRYLPMAATTRELALTSFRNTCCLTLVAQLVAQIDNTMHEMAARFGVHAPEGRCLGQLSVDWGPLGAGRHPERGSSVESLAPTGRFDET